MDRRNDCVTPSVTGKGDPGSGRRRLLARRQQLAETGEDVTVVKACQRCCRSLLPEHGGRAPQELGAKLLGGLSASSTVI